MKPLLPSGRRRGLSFLLPDDWTPEQALAAYELLDDLLAVIGDFYGVQLHEQLRRQLFRRELNESRRREIFGVR
ncbi:hypothetical protein WL48_10120 [Burkholderia ubonensis]|uniref:hypothetical protein n=1 Tax=Burkholderia ubonensis TaxID=101571 RepID=UPI00075E1F3D|nr:hypothetical protein [Burkholderia ubonensis]KWC40751.1 hypothetical protein WL48_10120 [Burkholderia ubonensis]KWC46147.1 hypothetical protein WL49_12090 [Burkholderia ubonensis]